MEKTLSERIENLFSAQILESSSYHVQDAQGMLKLDAMEFPFTWENEDRDDWIQCLNNADINRYPDPQASKIKSLLSKIHNISSQHDILFGNGSDELIQMLIMAVSHKRQTIMAPSPGFVMYKVIADWLGTPFVDVPLLPDCSLNVPGMLEEIDRSQPAIIFIATPNNPTGNIFDDKDLKQIINAAPGLVVLDEAYTAFTSSDQRHWLDQYKHVLVMRTFSKVGLAGLRFGFLMGHSNLIQELDKIRLPYNINCLTQLSVEFALQNFSLLEQHSQTICDERALLISSFSEMEVFECFNSEANFLTVRCLEHDAQTLYERLKAKNILIKCLHGSHPLLDQCLRITVGTSRDNKTLLNAMRDILSDNF
jgi:histidinol-phosphate aminotransferase